MKNALKYYYNLIPTSIHQINKKYKCYIDNQEYIFMQYEEPLESINDCYNLNIFLKQINIPCHEIILNIDHLALTYINNLPYILLKVYETKNKVGFNDILVFSNIFIDYSNYKKLICSNWHNMWTKKVDYLEYQVSQIGKKFPVIMDSFNYFVGLAENSISFLNEADGYIDSLVVSHRRIKIADDIGELYNPLNFLLDSKVRDASEYIKNKFFYDNYNIYEFVNDLQILNLHGKQYILFYSRLMFPSYYFDIYEMIISEKTYEKELNKILLKIADYMQFLKDVWLELNKYYNMPEIEWIIKM